MIKIPKVKNSKKFLRVNYGSTVHGKNELNAVIKVINSSTQMGKNVNKFENKIAKIFKKKYGVKTNSGTTALLLAMEALNLKKNSDIIEFMLIDKKTNEVKILFDKNSLEFKGWKTKDSYSNKVSFEINNLIINNKILDDFFKIPQEKDL